MPRGGDSCVSIFVSSNVHSQSVDTTACDRATHQTTHTQIHRSRVADMCAMVYASGWSNVAFPSLFPQTYIPRSSIRPRATAPPIRQRIRKFIDLASLTCVRWRMPRGGDTIAFPSLFPQTYIPRAWIRPLATTPIIRQRIGKFIDLASLTCVRWRMARSVAPLRFHLCSLRRTFPERRYDRLRLRRSSSNAYASSSILRR